MKLRQNIIYFITEGSSCLAQLNLFCCDSPPVFRIAPGAF
jgi:hypothetical protein